MDSLSVSAAATAAAAGVQPLIDHLRTVGLQGDVTYSPKRRRCSLLSQVLHTQGGRAAA
jgi:hypothetical protein